MQLEDFSWDFAGGMILILLIYLAMSIPLALLIAYESCKEEDEGDVEE